MTVGSLFSGIGGFDLGFERAGFEIRWQVENDPYCSAVLAQHWPYVDRYEDVRRVHSEEGCHGCDDCLEPVDVICGGFPCQPHSVAGTRLGAKDDRNLWPEFHRLICELGPRWVVAENVPGLLTVDAGRFFGGVLRDLAQSGYGVEWDCLPACAVGAPHRRDRVWIVAYTDLPGRREHRLGGAVLAPLGAAQRSGLCDTDRERQQQPRLVLGQERGRLENTGWWDTEPDVCRVAHGVPARVDRLRSLGNALVPQVAEWIARQIAAHDVSGPANRQR